ncbi:hypothetical protein FQA39_LY05670 [Lamprigera yunnana]|nr:hypothetical protein FQA39_LY05670 [Lamprigera yunnana]
MGLFGGFPGLLLRSITYRGGLFGGSKDALHPVTGEVSSSENQNQLNGGTLTFNVEVKEEPSDDEEEKQQDIIQDRADSRITKNQVEQVIKTTRSGKVAEKDETAPEMVKFPGNKAVEWLTKMISMAWGHKKGMMKKSGIFLKEVREIEDENPVDNPVQPGCTIAPTLTQNFINFPGQVTSDESLVGIHQYRD